PVVFNSTQGAKVGGKEYIVAAIRADVVVRMGDGERERGGSGTVSRDIGCRAGSNRTLISIGSAGNEADRSRADLRAIGVRTQVGRNRGRAARRRSQRGRVGAVPVVYNRTQGAKVGGKEYIVAAIRADV